jgi:ribonuclease T2
MNLFTIYILIIFLSSLVTANNNVNFDYYVLALSYTKTFCNYNTCNNDKIKPYFTIHGLWPSNLYGPSPADCKGEKYDTNILKNLKDELDQKWIEAKINSEFRKYEWNKHGTCSGLSLYEYFDKTLKLYDEINLNELIKNIIHINGSPKMDKTFLTSHLNENYPFVKLLCNNEYLEEIRFCLNKNYDLIDCQGSDKCPNEIIIKDFEYNTETSKNIIVIIILVSLVSLIITIVISLICCASCYLYYKYCIKKKYIPLYNIY